MIRAAFLVAALLLLAPEPALPQPTLRGVVQDASGAPIAGAPVLLHRLDRGAGAEVAGDTTDAAGAFALEIGEAGAAAVHFAAVRHGGALFVGPVFSGGTPPAEYRIVVRDGAAPGAVIMADGSVLPPVGAAAGAPMRPPAAAPPDPPSRAWALAVFLLVLGLAAAGGRAVLRRRRLRERRELLLELAGLEERGAPGDPQAVADLERERAALRERLRGAPA